MTRLLPFWFLACFLVACSQDADTTACAIGTEGCECTSGNACDPGLTCLSNRCVDTTGSTGGSVPESHEPSHQDGSGGTDSSGMSPSSPGDDETGGEDACLQAGGTRRPDGVCLLRCPSNPGGTIDDPNCPTAWWCHGVGYCTRYKQCDRDTDCDEPGQSTGGGYSCFAGWCYIACDANRPCPTGSRCGEYNHCQR